MSVPPPERPAERRGAARTAVLWEALRAALPEAPVEVLDVGGGTGGFAVRVAGLGHHVTVVDPSPDALAMLARRAQESGVSDHVRGVQGDLSDLAGPVGTQAVDVVLCHGVLEVLTDPAAALAALARCLRPDGLLSLLVAQRHAAVLARAMAGHLVQAREMLESPTAGSPAPRTRRYTHDELLVLVADAGLEVGSVHGVRVFADLVPGALLELEPGANQALVDLEHAAAWREEFFGLATQLHLLARAPASGA